ncbi:hypothetical protein TTRE_0000567501 [Trichuris trichiura]|uniref:Uncharacterized protein n=1 Tax=Trichuris trichiura TaxID=36087 RepID=A0A077ZCV9_TRITR|nr:hypothetical protein TTRE_0000567501 [Trichuris trichiura]
MTVVDHRTFSQLQAHIQDACSQIRFEQGKVLTRKIEYPYCTYSWEFRSSNRDRLATDHNVDNIVVDFSSTSLTSVEKVLSKELNVVPTPRMAPFLDIIASMEMSLTKTEPSKAAEVKGIISSSLWQLNRYEKPNLNRVERIVIKKSRKILIVTKADKGNVVVLSRKSNDVDKMFNQFLFTECVSR